jgi:hypothetical protein
MYNQCHKTKTVASCFLAAMQMSKNENNVLNIEIVLMLINMFMYVI